MEAIRGSLRVAQAGVHDDSQRWGARVSTIARLDAQFPGGWKGGSLPERGFWGRACDSAPVEDWLLKHARRLEAAVTLPQALIPFACESGRPHVDAGEQYRIGLTLVGDARGLIGRISAGLERVGGDRTLASKTTLGGNFEVVGTHALPPPDLPLMLERLASAANVTLRFVSPLRLERGSGC